MRTTFLRPQRRRLFHANQNLLLFFQVIHPQHPPGFTQRQDLLKHSLRYHTPHQKKQFFPLYPLKTSRNPFLVSASDNCSVTNLVSTPASGSTFPIGVTTVTSVATDASGNTNRCTFTVTVNDTQAPIISCPANLVFCSDAGQSSRSNVFFTVNASDNCTNVVVVSTPASGSTFPIGVTTVTSVATDASGNTNSCTFTVTVNQAVSVAPLVSLTNCPNTSATFAAVPSGTGPFSFVWKKGVLVASTNSSLVLPSVTLADAGTYTVEVSGACGSATNSASLVVNTNTAAASLTSLTKCSGDSATFSTVASGSGPFSYLWRKDGTNLVGQTNSSINLASVAAADAGLYSVVVSGSCNSVTNSATLAVSTATTATTFGSQTNCPGSTITFSTAASGTGPFAFVWKRGVSVLSGQTNTSITLTNISSANAGIYSVEVSGACRSVTNSASLVVNTNTTASALTNLTRCAGVAASFNSAASGTGPFSYVWRKNGNLLAESSSTLSFPSLLSSDAGTYSVEVYGACNSVTNSASLTVNTNLTITTLSPVVVCAGSTATFSTTPSGTGPFTYVWRKGSTAISGQTNSSLTFASVVATNAATYTVEVSGACNKATNSASLTIGSALTATALTNQSVCSCQSVTFATAAGGSGPFSFLWKKDGLVLPGQTSDTLFLQNLTNTDAGTYSVEVSGSCSTITRSATLTIQSDILQSPTTFANPATININDFANPNPGRATPYPSQLNVNCLFGTVHKVTLTLHGLSHGNPDDIDMLLVGPGGQAVKVMSDAGGFFPLENVTLTFDQLAATALPDEAQILSGSYTPTDFEINDLFLPPAPTNNYAANMLIYNGINPNGTWSLYIEDDQADANGIVVSGWSLEFTYEPASAPSITDLKTLANGTFQFTLNGEPSLTHIIEASTNLLNWTPISTNTLSGPSLIFIDPTSTTNNYRFFRAVRGR